VSGMSGQGSRHGGQARVQGSGSKSQVPGPSSQVPRRARLRSRVHMQRVLAAWEFWPEIGGVAEIRSSTGLPFGGTSLAEVGCDGLMAVWCRGILANLTQFESRTLSSRFLEDYCFCTVLNAKNFRSGETIIAPHVVGWSGGLVVL